MESITFSNISAKNIYNKTLSQVVTPEGREKVDILFHAAAMVDGNTELSEEEASKIKVALYRHDRGLFASLGIDFYREYDDNEVNNAWADSGMMGRSLAQEDWKILVNIKNKFARSLIWWFLPTLLYSNSKDGKEMLNLYGRLANHPKATIADLAQFIQNIKEGLEINSPYDKDSQSLKTEFDAPTFNPHEYALNLNSQIIRPCRMLYDELIFEYDLKKEFESKSGNIVYLTGAVKSENQFLRAKALLELGKSRRESRVIIDVLRSEKDSLMVVSFAFEALSFFEDEKTLEFLFSVIANWSFDITCYARSAIVHYANSKLVIRKLHKMLSSKDFFIRGEALNLLCYFVGHPEFKPYQTLLQDRAKATALDNNEEPLVRLTAKRFLNCLQKSEPLRMERPNDLYLAIAITTTAFFRYPKQLSWIVEKVKMRTRDLQNSSETIVVLSVGSSIGSESLSIIMAVLEDYHSNPLAWGNFDPRKQFKVIATDIDLATLRYLRRGIYHASKILEFDEVLGFYSYSRNFNGNGEVLLERYFQYDSIARSYKFKDEYRPMLEIRPLDIVEGDESLENKAFIVVYNNVAQYLPLGLRGNAVAQLIRLSQKYVTYALAPQDQITKTFLQMHGLNPPLGLSFLGFGEKQKSH